MIFPEQKPRGGGEVEGLRSRNLGPGRKGRRGWEDREGGRESQERQEWGPKHYWVTKGRVVTYLLKVSLMSWEQKTKGGRGKKRKCQLHKAHCSLPVP